MELDKSHNYLRYFLTLRFIKPTCQVLPYCVVVVYTTPQYVIVQQHKPITHFFVAHDWFQLSGYSIYNQWSVLYSWFYICPISQNTLWRTANTVTMVQYSLLSFVHYVWLELVWAKQKQTQRGKKKGSNTLLLAVVWYLIDFTQKTSPYVNKSLSFPNTISAELFQFTLRFMDKR